MSVPCVDCGMDTQGGPTRRDLERWEYYMVHGEVWAAGGLDRGCLCIGCLEARLGRQLEPSDFPTLPINDIFPRSARLDARMGGRAK